MASDIHHGDSVANDDDLLWNAPQVATHRFLRLTLRSRGTRRLLILGAAPHAPKARLGAFAECGPGSGHDLAVQRRGSIRRGRRSTHATFGGSASGLNSLGSPCYALPSWVTEG